MKLLISLLIMYTNILLGAEWIEGFLQCKVVLFKDAFFVGEPVIVKFMLINNTEEEIGLPYKPKTKRVPFGVKIFTEEKKEIQNYHQWVDRTYIGLAYTYLQSKDTIHYLWCHILCFGKKAKSGRYLLPGEKDIRFLPPGKYVLKYSFPSTYLKMRSSSLWHKTIYADSVVISVKRPVREVDKKALEEWKKVAFIMYYDPVQAPKKYVKIYDNIIHKYPNSVYAPYALYFLAENYRVRGRFKKAITLFRKLKTDYPEFPLNCLYEYNLACCYAGRGWMSVANSLLDRYLKKFPKDIRNQGEITNYIKKRHKDHRVFSD